MSGLGCSISAAAAGILSEPLTRLGAAVTGVDPSETNIEIARLHAGKIGLAIDYRATTAEALAEAGETFDVVLAMEVVEHVADVDAFVASCAALARPGGLLFVATINRTLKAFALAIVGAEYVLRWLPRGTHDYDKLVRPAELEASLRKAGWRSRTKAASATTRSPTAGRAPPTWTSTTCWWRRSRRRTQPTDCLPGRTRLKLRSRVTLRRRAGPARVPPQTMSTARNQCASSRWAAFQNAAFMRYWLSRLAAGFAAQIQTVAVGWQVYDITRNPLDLGFVGLSQFLPALLLVLVTGAVADRYRRRTIMAICLAVEALCAMALLVVHPERQPRRSGSSSSSSSAFGTARAFYNPAQQSLLPQPGAAGRPRQRHRDELRRLAARHHLRPGRGRACSTTCRRSSPTAPRIALLVVSAADHPAACRGAGRACACRQPASWETIVAGFRYIWHEKIVLGAISLDLFAVLLGGATALLPVYARDILHVDAAGLGLLRAGQAVGGDRRGALPHHARHPRPCRA